MAINYFGTSGNNANNGSTPALRNATWAGSVADTVDGDVIVLTTNGYNIAVATPDGIPIAENRTFKGENPVTSKITTSSTGSSVYLVSVDDLNTSAPVVFKDIYFDGATADALNAQYAVKFTDAGSVNIESIVFDGCTLANTNQGLVSIPSGGSLRKVPVMVNNVTLAGAYSSLPAVGSVEAPSGITTPTRYISQVSGVTGTLNMWSTVNFPQVINVTGAAGGNPWGTYKAVTVGNFVRNNFTVATTADATVGDCIIDSLVGSNGGELNVMDNHIIFDDSLGVLFTSPISSNVPSPFIDCQGAQQGVGNTQKVTGNTFHFPFAKSFCSGAAGSGSYSFDVTFNGNNVSTVYHATYKPFAFSLPDDATVIASYNNTYIPRAKCYGNNITAFYNGVIFEGRGTAAPSYATAKWNILTDVYGANFTYDGTDGGAATYNLIYQSGIYTQRDFGLFHAKKAVSNSSPTTTNATFSNNTVVVQDLSKIVALGTINDDCQITVDHNEYWLPAGTDLNTKLLFRVGGTSGAPNKTWSDWQALGYDTNSTITLGSYSELEQARMDASATYAAAYTAWDASSGGGSSSGGILSSVLGSILG